MSTPDNPNAQASSLYPLTGLTTACRAFNAISGRLAWCEFDPGFINSGVLRDRGSPKTIYSITGTLNSFDIHVGASATRQGAIFDGSQSIDLGSIFPTNADYSIFAVNKLSILAPAQVVVGSKNSNYRAIFFSNATGALSGSHNGGALFTSSTSRATGAVNRIGLTFVHSSKAFLAQYNGATDTAGTGSADNTDATTVIGALPGLAGDRSLRGPLYHVSIFNRALSGSDLVAVNAYLLEQYG